MNKYQELLGSRIREARMLQKLTQQELAEMVNISKRYLSDLENGRVNPSFDVLCAITRQLNISLDAIVYDDFRDLDRRMREITIAVSKYDQRYHNYFLNMLEAIVSKYDQSVFLMSNQNK